MRRARQDFFSDPYWPLEAAGPAAAHKNNSSAELSKDDIKLEANQSTHLNHSLFGMESRPESFSISIEKLTPEENHERDDSALKEPTLRELDLLQQRCMESESIDEDVGLKLEEESEPIEYFELIGQRLKKCPHGRYQILDLETKQFLVEQIQATSISAVAKRYGISINNLCRWKKSCERRRGAGRKVKNMALEGRLIDWISQQSIGSLTKRMIQEQAKRWSNDKGFKASKGWLERFANRNHNLQLAKLFSKQRKAFPARPSLFMSGDEGSSSGLRTTYRGPGHSLSSGGEIQ
jgi:hypothetical protein